VAQGVAEYLGHADPGFTLRVYAHLCPASEGRARAAVGQIFGSAGLGRPEPSLPGAGRRSDGPHRVL